MINKPLQQFVGVAANSIATLRIPVEDLTLIGVKLVLSGTTFTKANIDKIRVKLGNRLLWDLSKTQVDAINNYKNGADSTRTLLLDFTERDQALFPHKEIGGIDLLALAGVGECTIEVYIANTAVAPKIEAFGYFEQGQGNPFVLKYVPFSMTQTAAGRFTLPMNLRGALIKRLWFFYTGTNYTGATNGNVSRVESKKNGLVFFDQTCLDVRFDQSQFKKVPQANCFVMDCILDNNVDAHVKTLRTLEDGSKIYDSFEFNLFLTDAGGSTITAIAEVLDMPTNL